MTTGELIEFLQQYRPDTLVVRPDHQGWDNEVIDVANASLLLVTTERDGDYRREVVAEYGLPSRRAVMIS